MICDFKDKALEKAAIEWRLGNRKKAISLQEKAAYQDPSNYEIWKKLAFGYCYFEEYTKAHMALDRAEECGGRGDPQVWLVRSDVYDGQESLVSQVQCIKKATQINPKYKKSWDALRRVFQDMGLDDGAFKAYEKRTKDNYNNAKLYSDIGYSLKTELKDYDTASLCFKKAIELNRYYKQAHFGLAQCMEILNTDSKKTVQEYKETMNLCHPNDALYNKVKEKLSKLMKPEVS